MAALTGQSTRATSKTPEIIPATSSHCFIFDLPGELRDMVYAFAFSSISNSEVDLLHATCPSKARLSVSKQFYREAVKSYKSACCAHWRENVSMLNLDTCLSSNGEEIIQNMQQEDLQQMPSCHMFCPFYVYKRARFAYQRQTGKWSFHSDDAWSVTFQCHFRRIEVGGCQRVSFRYGAQEGSPRNESPATTKDVLLSLLAIRRGIRG